MKHIGDQACGHLPDRFIIAHHGVVVELAGDGNFLFQIGKSGLELEKICVGADLGIALHTDQKVGNRLSQTVIALDAFLTASGIHGRTAPLGDILQKAFLVGGEALHRVQKVGDQIEAQLELSVVLGSAVIHTGGELD